MATSNPVNQRLAVIDETNQEYAISCYALASGNMTLTIDICDQESESFTLQANTLTRIECILKVTREITNVYNFIDFETRGTTGTLRLSYVKVEKGNKVTE